MEIILNAREEQAVRETAANMVQAQRGEIPGAHGSENKTRRLG